MKRKAEILSEVSLGSHSRYTVFPCLFPQPSPGDEVHDIARIHVILDIWPLLVDDIAHIVHALCIVLVDDIARIVHASCIVDDNARIHVVIGIWPLLERRYLSAHPGPY